LRLAPLAFLAFCAAAVAAPPALSPQPFVSGLALPVEIAHAGDGSGRLFVVEQGGRIRVIREGQLLSTPFLDLSAANGGPVFDGGERGLLGLAFHPAYAANGRFYVFYTRSRAGDPNGNDIVVARYARSANADVADPSSASTVIVIAHPTHSNHNGGKIAFGPDGYLYVAVGDGGGGGDPFNAAQSLADPRGKILRLDVDSATPYAIPSSNPFAAAAPPVRREIWALGLRNPWRFTFDRATGDVFIGDVGQNAWEEVDFQPAGVGGRNYGWRVFEGTHCFDPPSGCSLAGHVPPILEYDHGTGFSVTGGYRYRGGALPALSGFYVYGDYGGSVWAAEPGPSGSWVTAQVATVPNLSTFGEDENGELYAANHGEGTIVRLTPPASTISRLANISARARVLTGDDVLIGGFILGGSGPKTVVVRARGPSLAAFGVPDTLANPTIQLFAGQTPLASNDDWGDAPNALQIQATGLAPSDPAEAAIMAALPPGGYTAIVSGVGIVEVFEDDHPERPLANLSARARVLTGDDVAIGGFIIQGDAPRTVLVRARGPSLAAFGVPSTLANPVLQLFAGQTPIAINDDWGTASNATQIQASGLAPTDSREAAILMALPPGRYTGIVTGAGGTTGVGIVEVFQLP
jgi:glucose/arabinose dehydrogenase